MQGEPEASDEPETGFEAIRHAYGAAVEEITSAIDARDGFDRATALADLLRELADAAADIRAKTARRIWESEKLSLAALAERVGVSKARAAQFVKAAEKQRAEE